MEEKKICYWKTGVNLLLSLIATAFVILVGIKAIFFFMPFVIGWMIALIASPLVKWLEKRLKIVRKLGTAIIIVAVLALIVLGIYFIISRLWILTMGFVDTLPDYYVYMELEMNRISEQFNGTFQQLPDVLRDAIVAIYSNMDSYVGEMIGRISEPTVSAAGEIAMKIPSYLISFIIMILAAYFFTADRESVNAWTKKYVPQSIRKRMVLIIQNLKFGVGGYFKAQFKIMWVIFLILTVAFFFLKIPYAILLALCIAALDFFPILGTGTVMIPWMIVKLIVGDYRLAIIVIVLYVITLLTHQLLQPKLVADSVGINPIWALLLLYVGYRFDGVIGMILAIPIGLIGINLVKAGAFDYIIDDVKILVKGILSLRE